MNIEKTKESFQKEQNENIINIQKKQMRNIDIIRYWEDKLDTPTTKSTTTPTEKTVDNERKSKQSVDFRTSSSQTLAQQNMFSNFHDRQNFEKQSLLEHYFQKENLDYQNTGVEYTNYQHNGTPHKSWQDIDDRCTPDFYVPKKNVYVEHKTTNKSTKATVEFLPLFRNYKTKPDTEYCFYVVSENKWYFVPIKTLLLAIDTIYISTWREDLGWQNSTCQKLAEKNNKHVHVWKQRPTNSLASGTPYVQFDLNKLECHVVDAGEYI